MSEPPPVNANDPNYQVIEEFRRSGGQISGPLSHLPLLLLTTTGARSGLHRTVPVTYVRNRDDYLLAAGAGGGNPAWYHNVVAQPAVIAEVGARVFTATARVTSGDERAELFDYFAQDQPQLHQFQAQANRPIPMVLITPLPSQ